MALRYTGGVGGPSGAAGVGGTAPRPKCRSARPEIRCRTKGSPPCCPTGAAEPVTDPEILPACAGEVGHPVDRAVPETMSTLGQRAATAALGRRVESVSGSNRGKVPTTRSAPGTTTRATPLSSFTALISSNRRSRHQVATAGATRRPVSAPDPGSGQARDAHPLAGGDQDQESCQPAGGSLTVRRVPAIPAAGAPPPPGARTG